MQHRVISNNKKNHEKQFVYQTIQLLLKLF
jgi:hypothetical protein